ncbi:hypothetical protein PTKIN_Ptkin01aG0296400 [Pterospermum kingtungense]
MESGSRNVGKPSFNRSARDWKANLFAVFIDHLSVRHFLKYFSSVYKGWKANMLSFEGSIVLIRSVLSSLPIYFMSLFQILATVKERLDRIKGDSFGAEIAANQRFTGLAGMLSVISEISVAWA